MRPPKLKFNVYKDKKGEWRWTAIKNYRKVEDGSEGYKRKGAMLKTLNSIIAAIQANDFYIQVSEE
jgi:uncharacterized protein YegP (UPF0339 family)